MISRDLVLELLRQKQDSSGGYTGDDLIEIATILEVTPRGLRRRLNNWINTDDDFQQFIYLGKKKPPITLFEFFKIEQGLESNPIQPIILTPYSKLLVIVENHNAIRYCFF